MLAGSPSPLHGDLGKVHAFRGKKLLASFCWGVFGILNFRKFRKGPGQALSPGIHEWWCGEPCTNSKVVFRAPAGSRPTFSPLSHSSSSTPVLPADQQPFLLHFIY